MEDSTVYSIKIASFRIFAMKEQFSYSLVIAKIYPLHKVLYTYQIQLIVQVAMPADYNRGSFFVKVIFLESLKHLLLRNTVLIMIVIVPFPM